MTETVVAKRYARALMALAKEQDKVQKVAEDFGSIVDAYQDSEVFQNTLSNPKVSKKDKSLIIKSISEKLNLDSLLKTFCQFLVEKKRIDLIYSIFEVFHSMVDETLNREHVELTVAKKLQADEKQKIQNQIAKYINKEVVLAEKVDPSILGGAITRIKSIVLDGSLRNQLNLLHENILKG